MTNNPPYIPPAYGAEVFTCLYCGVPTSWYWSEELSILVAPINVPLLSPAPIRLGRCSHCEGICLWVDKKLTIPEDSGMPPPNSDLHDEVKELYNEAASIVRKSPRAAVALLRLALEILLGKLVEKGNSNYEKIQNFMNETNPPQEIVEMMHAIRDTGNDAVHSVNININETPRIAELLFHFISDIAEETLTKERIRKERLKNYNSIKPAKKRKPE